MSTKIAWCVHPDGSPGETWNPVVGCSATSPGCGNCYAARLASTRLAHLPDYQGLAVDGKWVAGPRFLPHRLDAPLRRRKPTGYFVCDMGDLVHEGVSDEQIAAVFGVMATCPRHRFYVLTKRAARMRRWFEWAQRLPFRGNSRDGAPVVGYLGEHALRATEGQVNIWLDRTDLPDWPLPNVWVGVTVENQAAADERLPDLMNTPAAVRFVSVEPMLGQVDLRLWLPSRKACARCSQGVMDADGPAGPGNDHLYGRCKCGCHLGLDWVIIGSESGPRARPCDLSWVRSLVEQCQAAGVATFCKQLQINGRLSHDPAEWPEWARVREFPEVSQ